MKNELYHIWQTARFMPEGHSGFSSELNSLSLYLLVVSVFFIIAIFSLMIFFAIYYRRRTPDQLAYEVKESVALEITWMAVPFLIILVAFAWGAKLFFKMETPPKNAELIYVDAKQWMWKFEHEDGSREINNLHIPINRDIHLVMISQDVIHSFFVPAFRMKFDVLPGRYTQAWFRTSELGDSHLVCTQYCGTDHSLMIGTVIAQSPQAYEQWKNEMKTHQTLSQNAIRDGESLFRSKACINCHNSPSLAPSLNGLYMKPVHLQDGRTVLADELYLRKSILEPASDIVAGYGPSMPTYAGQLSEEEIGALISYVRAGVVQ
jgi:cytochrome c oxidase subunit 2